MFEEEEEEDAIVVGTVILRLTGARKREIDEVGEDG